MNFSSRVLISSLIAILVPPAGLPTHSAVCARDDFGNSTPMIEGKEKRLTHDGRLKHDPVFVESGKFLVYTSQEKFNLLSLMKIPFSSMEDTQPTRLHPAANTSELMVSFARDENDYAYLRNNGNLHFEIVLENKQSGTSIKYNPGGGFAGIRNISYSPDGSNVIFAFPNQNGPQQIQSLTSDGKKVSLLTNSEGVNVSPSYSSDGKRITFASSRDGDFDIFVMNSDGSNPVNVSNQKGMDRHPRFSPDGKQIAFTGNRNGNYDIYLMDSDGSKVRRLTTDTEIDDFPCWSPDGKNIVWVAERNGKRDLFSKQVPLGK